MLKPELFTVILNIIRLADRWRVTFIPKYLENLTQKYLQPSSSSLRDLIIPQETNFCVASRFAFNANNKYNVKTK